MYGRQLSAQLLPIVYYRMFLEVPRHLSLGLLTYCGLLTVPKGYIDSYLHNDCPFEGYILFLGGTETSTCRVIDLLWITDCSLGFRDNYLRSYCPYMGYRLFLAGTETANYIVIALLWVTDCSLGVHR